MLYDSDEEEDSVFSLGEQACFELASVSIELQTPQEKKFLYKHNFIFSRMLWGEYQREQSVIT